MRVPPTMNYTFTDTDGTTLQLNGDGGIIRRDVDDGRVLHRGEDGTFGAGGGFAHLCPVARGIGIDSQKRIESPIVLLDTLQIMLDQVAAVQITTGEKCGLFGQSLVMHGQHLSFDNAWHQEVTVLGSGGGRLQCVALIGFGNHIIAQQ